MQDERTRLISPCLKAGVLRRDFIIFSYMRKAAKKREKRSKTEISGDFGIWGGKRCAKI